MDPERTFLAMVLRNRTIATILDRAPDLGLPHWWLTGGAVFQTVWNVLEGRPPEAGIRDYDLFYFEPDDLSAAGEAGAARAAATHFADLDTTIDTCNEARVHLWYEAEFGAPGRPFTSTREAIDHFAAIACCYGLRRRDGAEVIDVYAPHGYADLLARRVRANPVLVPRAVYEAKVARWSAQWPSLRVEPWPADRATDGPRDPSPSRGSAVRSHRRM